MAMPNLANEIYRFLDALEGEVYYKNLLTEDGFRAKYFSALFEDDDPVIAIPLTSSFIDRIISILRANVTITSDNPEVDKRLPELLEMWDYTDLMKGVQSRTLATGNNSVWLSVKDEANIVLTPWESYYTSKLFNDSNEVEGYAKHYIMNNGVMEPNTSNDNRRLKGKNKFTITELVDDTTWRKFRDDEIAYEEEHGFGFTPVTWFDSIDKSKEKYGIPYVNRFKNLLNNLNNTYSEAQRAVLVFQNIWITNKDFQDPEKPISLNPRNIQFVGTEGKLEQSIKNLDLGEEWTLIGELKKEIQRAAQMPSDAFLDGLAKVESGVALKLQYTPLFELISLVENSFQEKEEELVYKAVSAQLDLEGKSKEFNISVDYNTNILPVDEAADFKFDVERKNAGAISQEYFNSKWGEEADNGFAEAKEAEEA